MADVARLSSAHITRLPPRVALYLQASIVVAFLAASRQPAWSCHRRRTDYSGS